jgi:hypothetical protein
MPSYFLFNANGDYQNTIWCEGSYELPEGWTRQLLEDGQFWQDGKITSLKQQIDSMLNKITLKEI